jgi:translation elongation factor EF-Ts
MNTRTQMDLIRELREETGSGMQDVKHALDLFNNHKEKARYYLRESGLAVVRAKDYNLVAIINARVKN